MQFSNHYLTRILHNGKVPHTLLFHGPKDAQKKEAAESFARALLGKTAAQKKEAPDLHIYAIEKEGGLHSIETIRALIDEAALPPFEADASVFIIEDAERMLPAAANALLKTLEEPLDGRYFILLVNEIEEILPTILSRSCEVAFHSMQTEGNESYAEFVSAFFSGEYSNYAKAVKALEEKEDLKPERVVEEIVEEWRRRYLLSQNPNSIDLAHAQKVVEQLRLVKLALARHVKLRVILDSLFFAIMR